MPPEALACGGRKLATCTTNQSETTESITTTTTTIIIIIIITISKRERDNSNSISHVFLSRNDNFMIILPAYTVCLSNETAIKNLH